MAGPRSLATFDPNRGKVVALPTAASAQVVQACRRIPRGVTKLKDYRRKREFKDQQLAELREQRDAVALVVTQISEEIQRISG